METDAAHAGEWSHYCRAVVTLGGVTGPFAAWTCQHQDPSGKKLWAGPREGRCPILHPVPSCDTAPSQLLATPSEKGMTRGRFVPNTDIPKPLPGSLEALPDTWPGERRCLPGPAPAPTQSLGALHLWGFIV